MKGELFESQKEHTLVGFATVQGILTAKFVSEGETTVQPPPLEGKAKEESEKLAKLRAEMKSMGVPEEDLPPLDLSPPVVRDKTVTYVELATGVVVRAETECIAGSECCHPLEDGSPGLAFGYWSIMSINFRACSRKCAEKVAHHIHKRFNSMYLDQTEQTLKSTSS